MQCQDVINMLSAYLDGALDPAEREAIRNHLAGCSACNVELQELMDTIQLLKELPALTPPAEFRDQLMEKIDQLDNMQTSTEPSNLFGKINAMARSSWYRVAAVAAVMAMTLGLSSLWDKEVKPLLPVDPKTNNTIVAVQEPREQNEEPTNTTDPDTQVGPSDINSKGAGSNKPATATSPSTEPSNTEAVNETPTRTKVTNPVSRQVENFTPQPSEGLVASSVTLKLDVQEIEPALKSIGKITQDNHGSNYTDFSGSTEAGTISIKVPRKSLGSVIGALQQLGTMTTYLPTEKDLSNVHQEAKQKLEQLRQREEDLQVKLTAGQDDQVEKELSEVNAQMQGQINVIKDLEDRSTYSIITINLYKK